jgi:hypothetical protein
MFIDPRSEHNGPGRARCLLDVHYRLRKNKHDPRNHTKLHEMDALIRVISCNFVDRLGAWTAPHHFSAACSGQNAGGAACTSL